MGILLKESTSVKSHSFENSYSSFQGMSVPSQAFPSFCTVCDVQLDAGSASQIYCSEQCRVRDSSTAPEASSSVPSHWYDLFNNVGMEPGMGLGLMDHGDLISPPTSARNSFLSVRCPSSRGSMSSFSSTLNSLSTNSNTGKLLSLQSPWSDNSDPSRLLPNDMLSASVPTADLRRRVTNGHERHSSSATATTSPFSDSFSFDKNNEFESHLGVLENISPDTYYDPMTLAPRTRRHSLYIKSGMHLYTGTSSRRPSFQEPSNGTTNTSDVPLSPFPDSPRSIGLVLPPQPVKKPVPQLEYEVPKLRPISPPPENAISEKKFIY